MSLDSKNKLDEYTFDFSARSEEFLETFFRKGAQFTEQLLSETQKMRATIRDLSDENVKLRSQLASDDAIRDLLMRVNELEDEKHNFRLTADEALKEFKDYEDRYGEMENELDQMANLYVASSQLSSTMDISEIFSIIEQMLMQLVGVSKIAIFLRFESEGQLVLKPVHVFHCDELKGCVVKWGESPVGEAAATQVNYIAEPKKVKDNEPIACIPMVFAGQTIGVTVIYGMLEQKDEFVSIDYELFRLLSTHSSSAIISSGLFARVGNITEAMSCFASL